MTNTEFLNKLTTATFNTHEATYIETVGIEQVRVPADKHWVSLPEEEPIRLEKYTVGVMANVNDDTIANQIEGAVIEFLDKKWCDTVGITGVLVEGPVRIWCVPLSGLNRVTINIEQSYAIV